MTSKSPERQKLDEAREKYYPYSPSVLGAYLVCYAVLSLILTRSLGLMHGVFIVVLAAVLVGVTVVEWRTRQRSAKVARAMTVGAAAVGILTAVVAANVG